VQAEKFHSGNFYRVRDLRLAQCVERYSIGAEGLALTGAEVDKEKG
jgi:hypothetical protein